MYSSTEPNSWSAMRRPLPGVSGLHPGLGPPLEHPDLGRGPGAVARHGAVLQPLEDIGGVAAHVVGGPQVEGEAHRLPVALAEQRLDVGGEAHLLVRSW